MSPPYKFIDEATGEVIWSGVDTKAGRSIEIFADGVERISPGALVRPGSVVTPPPVDPPPVDPPPIDPPPPVVIPPTGDGMIRPANETELLAALQNAANTGTMCLLDPFTKVTLTKTMNVQCVGNDGSPWGVNGNGAKILWGGPAGQRMLVYKGAVADGNNFRSNRGLIIEKLFFDGKGTSGDCLSLEALYGDPGSIYKSVLRDVYTVYSGANGITYRGAIFESFCDNVHAENCLGHGMETKHDTTSNGMRGIISNININHPNFSRNKGAGLKCTYSTNLTFGSFVLNAQGGVVAEEGLRAADKCNGENTGEGLFIVPSNGYGSVITACEVSSDGSTHHRQFENGAWVSYGKPCLYLLVGAAPPIIQQNNHCSYYGSAPTSPMRVVK